MGGGTAAGGKKIGVPREEREEGEEEVNAAIQGIESDSWVPSLCSWCVSEPV